MNNLPKQKTEVFYISTDFGFVAYEDSTGRMYHAFGFAMAEPYFSQQQAEIAAKNLNIKTFCIMKAVKTSFLQIPGRSK